MAGMVCIYVHFISGFGAEMGAERESVENIKRGGQTLTFTYIIYTDTHCAVHTMARSYRTLNDDADS